MTPYEKLNILLVGWAVLLMTLAVAGAAWYAWTHRPRTPRDPEGELKVKINADISGLESSLKKGQEKLKEFSAHRKRAMALETSRFGSSELQKVCDKALQILNDIPAARWAVWVGACLSTVFHRSIDETVDLLSRAKVGSRREQIVLARYLGISSDDLESRLAQGNFRRWTEAFCDEDGFYKPLHIVWEIPVFKTGSLAKAKHALDHVFDGQMPPVPDQRRRKRNDRLFKLAAKKGIRRVGKPSKKPTPPPMRKLKEGETLGIGR